jgi:choline monooxygenase
MQTPPLLPKDYFVNEDIAQAESLPAEAFQNRDVLTLEQETVFRNSWQMIPEPNREDYASDPRSTAHRVSEPSTHAPLELNGVPLFLKRDSQGTLRLFPNVCTHAWYPLVTECGKSKDVVCKQHGRRFNDQGQFLSQAAFENLPNFPRPCDHLQSKPLHSFGQWLFGTLGKPTNDFETVFKPIRESLAKMNVESWPRALQDREERTVPGNWKQHAWNFMDKFHIPLIHHGPHGLIDALHYRDYRTEIYAGAALQWAYAKNPDHGFNPEHLPHRFRNPAHPERRVFSLWWLIFPNLTLNVYPWGMSINRYEPVPGTPDKTQFFWRHYVADSEKYNLRETNWLNQRVDEEDVVAMNRVAKGIKSGMASRGRFAPQEEKGPHWFHREVYKHLFSDQI